MIAQALNEGKNAIKIHDKDFDESISYQIRLANKDFCIAETVVNVDGFSFCGEVATIFFELPCMEIGQYKLDIIKTISSDVAYTLNSKYIS